MLRWEDRMIYYRLVVSGDEFCEYERHWEQHDSLPEGVTSVVVDGNGNVSEFFVPVTIDYEAIEYAWTAEGPSPEYHRAAKRQLRKDWPRLWEALTDAFDAALGGT